jgi:EF hand
MNARSALINVALAVAFAAASTATLAQNAAPPKGAQDRAALEAAFTRADANGDGKLSKEEAARLPAIAAKFAELDKDKDGFLSIDEFASGYAAGN